MYILQYLFEFYLFYFESKRNFKKEFYAVYQFSRWTVHIWFTRWMWRWFWCPWISTLPWEIWNKWFKYVNIICDFIILPLFRILLKFNFITGNIILNCFNGIPSVYFIWSETDFDNSRIFANDWSNSYNRDNSLVCCLKI